MSAAGGTYSMAMRVFENLSQVAVIRRATCITNVFFSMTDTGPCPAKQSASNGWQASSNAPEHFRNRARQVFWCLLHVASLEITNVSTNGGPDLRKSVLTAEELLLFLLFLLNIFRQ